MKKIIALIAVLALFAGLTGTLTACKASGNTGDVADCTSTLINPTTTGYDDGSGITVKRVGPVLWLAVGVVWVTCVKKPDQLAVDIEMWYKPSGFNGDFKKINSNSAVWNSSNMPGLKPQGIPVTSPCVTGDYQIRVSATGHNPNGQFVMPDALGNTTTLTAADCHHQ